MAYSLNKKLSELKPYDPIEGEYKIRLDANESYYNINDDMSKEISKAISELSLNRYPDPYSANAIKAFADFYDINSEYITAGNGSDELISIITSCFLEKNDKVVTLTPDFSMYSFYSSLYELEVMQFQKDSESLNFDVNELVDFCNTNNAKMLIFSNPCNPTSLGIEKKDILNLLENLSCLVVVDEAYMDFWDESILDEIKNYDNLIILKTCSKAIGLAGVRFGFAVAGKTITNALKAAKSPYNTDLVSQKIVEVVLKNKDFLSDKMSEIIKQKDQLLLQIDNLTQKYNAFEKVYDSKTNFVYIKTKYAKVIFEKLLENSIAVRCFDGFLRINTGSKEENSELIRVLEEILKTLK